MTRSTRRIDPFKSNSTTSNRFSHSIDSAVKEKVGVSLIALNPLQVKTGDENMSHMEDISFIDERERLKKPMTAKEKLSDLAF